MLQTSIHTWKSHTVGIYSTDETKVHKQTHRSQVPGPQTIMATRIAQGEKRLSIHSTAIVDRCRGNRAMQGKERKASGTAPQWAWRKGAKTWKKGLAFHTHPSRPQFNHNPIWPPESGAQAGRAGLSRRHHHCCPLMIDRGRCRRRRRARRHCMHASARPAGRVDRLGGSDPCELLRARHISTSPGTWSQIQFPLQVGTGRYDPPAADTVSHSLCCIILWRITLASALSMMMLVVKV